MTREKTLEALLNGQIALWRKWKDCKEMLADWIARDSFSGEDIQYQRDRTNAAFDEYRQAKRAYHAF